MRQIQLLFIRDLTFSEQGTSQRSWWTRSLRLRWRWRGRSVETWCARHVRTRKVGSHLTGSSRCSENPLTPTRCPFPLKRASGVCVSGFLRDLCELLLYLLLPPGDFHNKNMRYFLRVSTNTGDWSDLEDVEAKYRIRIYSHERINEKTKQLCKIIIKIELKKREADFLVPNPLLRKLYSIPRTLLLGPDGATTVSSSSFNATVIFL